ncbi:MAG: glycerol-3-phosphate dehydrogenase subunit GlpB [Desulfopila sp.]|jgi:glycerol-3-phosphate dehydrogenase subunit B|nr:glycerol-3-phosphate dehydrogenase subunit GlpB [Desulfopila sp.]
MKQETRYIDTELAVIGTGLAGIAAAIFALNRGISCTLTGNTGALAYTTGYLDLLGFSDSRFISAPWDALGDLAKSCPGHPLAGIAPTKIAEAFTEFTNFIGSIGVGYSPPGQENLRAITPAGTLKPTLCVPLTMIKGITALHSKAPCTVFGFHGLKGFSAHQIAANLKSIWPEIEARTIHFPGHESGELYAEVAARALEVPQNRILLAEILKHEGAGSSYLGLPAILGMHNPDEIHADLERLSGFSIFEIPTMPPSVPGIRLREIIEQTLPAKGITMIPQQKIRKIEFHKEKITLSLFDNYGPIAITARTVLLATGRFLSGGLEAHFDHISEPLIHLPVHQPPSREKWYQEEYLDSRGHEIHLAGIETDGSFRPLKNDGTVYDKRLFAAGIVLAHQDWIRQRCGAGVAIATASAAVDAIIEHLAQ